MMKHDETDDQLEVRPTKRDGNNKLVLKRSHFNRAAILYRDCVEKLYLLHIEYFSVPISADHSALRANWKDLGRIQQMSNAVDKATERYQDYCHSFHENGEEHMFLNFPDPIDDWRIKPLRSEHFDDAMWFDLHRKLQNSTTLPVLIACMAFTLGSALFFETPWSFICFGLGLLTLRLPIYRGTLESLRHRARQLCMLEPLGRGQIDTNPLIDYDITYCNPETPWERCVKTDGVIVPDHEFAVVENMNLTERKAFFASKIKGVMPMAYSPDLGAALITAQYFQEQDNWLFEAHLFYRASHAEDFIHAERAMLCQSEDCNPATRFYTFNRTEIALFRLF